MNWSLTSAPDLSEQQFLEWKRLLELRVGISVGESQKQFLQSQVSMRMREIGETDFTRYMEKLCDGVEGNLEWMILLDRLVVKETSFFRHQPSFDFVCAYLQNKINNKLLKESFEVWSLGCSTGEEAYSLTMMINEIFELAKLDPYFGITGTDVSRNAIARARSGKFASKKVAFVPTALRNKYFQSQDKKQFYFDHDVANKVCFANSNILNLNKIPNLGFDIIFCQNLLIYFSQKKRKALLDEIVDKLKFGGVLVLGLGEVTSWANSKMERVARTDVQAYVRV